VFCLYTHQDAQDDLDSLWETDEQAAADIMVCLQEIEGDQDLLDRLNQDRFGAEFVDDFNVRLLIEQRDLNNNLWRLRVWSVPNYRIIYAFIPSNGRFYVLGIMPRGVDYARNHPFFKRIAAAYEQVRTGDW
jgi:hypothetical protein